MTSTTAHVARHGAATTPPDEGSVREDALPAPDWRDRRRFTWETGSGRALAVRVDEPAGRQAVGALVVVPSFGREATVSFRAIRALAAYAAAAGFVAYSFDLSGDGDSQALSPDADPARCWTADAEAVVALARTAVGDDAPVHVVGLRLGAAILAGVPPTGPGRRVHWEPVSGRMFLRLHRLIREQSVGGRLVSDGVELDGAHLSDTQACGITALRAPRRGAPDAAADETIRLETDRQAALRIALGAPYFADVPLDAIREIIADLPPGPARELPAWAPTTEATLKDSRGRTVVETICAVGSRGLPAVLTRAPGVAPHVGVAFSAMGAEVKSGPAGLWAQAARELAGDGVVSLRADRALLGDDAEPTRAAEPRPYTDASVGSVVESVRTLRAEIGDRPVVGIGLCAGAWSLLRAAPECAIDELVAVNAVHFNPDERVYDEAFYQHYHGEEAPALAAGESPDAEPAGEDVPSERLGRVKEAASRELAIRFPWLRSALRPGVPVDHVALLVDRVPSSTAIRFVFGVEEHRIFAGKGGRRALRRASRRGGEVREIVDPRIDHSLFSEAGRRRMRELLREVLVRDRGRENGTRQGGPVVRGGEN